MYILVCTEFRGIMTDEREVWKKNLGYPKKSMKDLALKVFRLSRFPLSVWLCEGEKKKIYLIFEWGCFLFC